MLAGDKAGEVGGMADKTGGTDSMVVGDNMARNISMVGVSGEEDSRVGDPMLRVGDRDSKEGDLGCSRGENIMQVIILLTWVFRA